MLLAGREVNVKAGEGWREARQVSGHNAEVCHAIMELFGVNEGVSE